MQEPKCQSTMNLAKRPLSFFLFFFSIALLFWGCQSDSKPEENSLHIENATIHVRQDTEPNGLNPFLSAMGYVFDVSQHIFLPLMEYHPVKLSYDPVLVKGQPKIKSITEGEFAGGMSYTYEILDEAKWDNGEPVTAYDYAFTIKMVLNPRVNASVWRGHLSYIKDVQFDPDMPNTFTVLTFPQNILSKELTGNFFILPEYIFDPQQIMRNYSFADLADMEKATDLAKKDTLLQFFADQFQTEKYSRSPEGVVGCGPYKLKEWESGRRIVLERKENYWADVMENPAPLLQGYPPQLIFEPIPDFTAATSKLMSGEIDVIGALQPQQFEDLRGSEQVAANYDFYTPEIMQYYWMPLNTRSPLLSDKRVRRALAHMVDLNKIQEEYMYGMAARIVGPIHPTATYYNDSLPLIAYDLDKAAQLISEAGWEDTNGNGIVDKVVDGKRRELEIRFFAYPASELSQKFGMIMKENARKLGVDIQIVIKDFSIVRSEHVARRDFEIFSSRSRHGSSLYDPYQSWHTDSDRPDGGNYTGFGNNRSNEIIEAIRSEVDEEKRENLYREFQKILYEEQPGIFLFAPKDGLLVHKRFEAFAGPKRPGFFPALYKLR